MWHPYSIGAERGQRKNMAYYNIEKRQRADGPSRYRGAIGVRKDGRYNNRVNRIPGEQRIGIKRTEK